MQLVVSLITREVLEKKPVFCFKKEKALIRTEDYVDASGLPLYSSYTGMSFSKSLLIHL